MKKFGPITVIISGVFTLVISILVVLILFKVINKDYVPPLLGKFIGTQILERERYCKIFFISISSISFLQILLAISFLKKIRFWVLSFIFMFIAIQIGFSVYHCMKLNAFSIYNIVNLYILGMAELGMILAYFKKNR